MRVVACALVCALGACAPDPVLPPVDAVAHRAAVDAWRDSQKVEMSAPGAPLSYTGLDWLHAGPNTVGADSSNDIVLPGDSVPAHVGTIVKAGDRVRFEPAPGALVMLDGQPADASPLRTDKDPGSSSRIQAGSAGLRLIRRLDSIAVRRWDLHRAAYVAFRGAHYYPDDVRWRVAGRFVPYVPAKKMRVQTEVGIEQELAVVGTVRARIANTTYKLTTFEGDSAADLWIVFKDLTNGSETYGFRFLKAARDTATNVVTLDFNRAYNPDCAYTPFATCPLPPRENRIGTAIPAGEKVYDSHIAERH